jgi:hypothetical protein
MTSKSYFISYRIIMNFCSFVAIYSPACHSDPALAGEESQVVNKIALAENAEFAE